MGLAVMNRGSRSWFLSMLELDDGVRTLELQFTMASNARCRVVARRLNSTVESMLGDTGARAAIVRPR